MKELERILKEFVEKGRLTDTVEETLADIKELNDRRFEEIKKENIEDKTEEYKRLRFTIKNNISGCALVQFARENNYLTLDNTKQIAEEIAKEYLK